MSNDRDDIQPTTLPRYPDRDAFTDAESVTLYPVTYTTISTAPEPDADSAEFSTSTIAGVADEPELAADFAEFFSEPVEDPASEEVKAARLDAVIRRGEEIIAARAKARGEGQAHRAGDAEVSTGGPDQTAAPDQQDAAREVPSSPSIFVAGRRGDTDVAGAHIDIALRREFGEKKVFRDGRFITKGGHFTDEIRRNLGRCDILVVVLGPRWALEAEGTDRRAIDSFWVRREIAIAFESGLAVLPVLVDGAVLPDRNELPDDIKPLADRQALSFRTYLGHLDFPPLFQAIREAVPTGGNERRDGDGTPTGAQETGPFRQEEGRV
ncbi:hypothetical protein GCM10010306_021660 [Streptomyces umbrinus]|uniref:toll/interleukin-1 receptor domain-containing protein n=1 Tax=Streptomyces umbrinus TaxID=67370 RepID=UPI0016733EAD|nr:toll/interleukin-1 receptor domain-containing protein [Streptomyces umbrinus]GHB28912.1 hypothetical protein GCM10010306_021660 [Streptomyces umbrinus]